MVPAGLHDHRGMRLRVLPTIRHKYRGRGVSIIANDVPAHREVLGDAGAYYARNSPEDLGREMRALAEDAGLRRRFGQLARERARSLYPWEHVTNEYERLFRVMLGSPAE